MEVAFRPSASFLYFRDISVKFCDLFSISESTAPRCSTSSMFCTMMRWTSCSSVLRLLSCRRPLLSL